MHSNETRVCVTVCVWDYLLMYSQLQLAALPLRVAWVFYWCSDIWIMPEQSKWDIGASSTYSRIHSIENRKQKQRTENRNRNENRKQKLFVRTKNNPSIRQSRRARSANRAALRVRDTKTNVKITRIRWIQLHIEIQIHCSADFER